MVSPHRSRIHDGRPFIVDEEDVRIAIIDERPIKVVSCIQATVELHIQIAASNIAERRDGVIDAAKRNIERNVGGRFSPVVSHGTQTEAIG